MYRRQFSTLPGFLPLSWERSSEVARAKYVSVSDESVEMTAVGFEAQKSVADLVREVGDWTHWDLGQRQRKLAVMMRTNPKLAVGLILRYSQLLPALSGFCQQSAAVARAFCEVCRKSQIVSRDLLMLANVFESSGSVDISIHLLAQCHRRDFDFQFAKDLLWLLFADRRFAQLYGWLSFAFASSPPAVPGVDVLRFVQCFRNVATFRPQTRVAVTSPVWPSGSSRELTPKESLIIPVLFIAALFCFSTGVFDAFADMRNLLAPVVIRFLNDKSLNFIVRMFVFACAAFDRIDTVARVPANRVFALGDENVMFLAYQECGHLGPIIAHPISNLKISTFGSGGPSIQKTVFWNRVEELAGFRLLILCIGTHDVMSTVPQYVEGDAHISFGTIFALLATALCEVIEQIRECVPGIAIAVHAIFEKEEVDVRLVRLFNETLAGILPADVRFIDLVANPQDIVMGARQDDARREKVEAYWAGLPKVWASFADIPV
jgi:hypothetical protein